MIPSSAKGATLILTEQPLPEDCVEPVALLPCVGEEKVSDNLETLGACKKAPLALLTPRRGETTAEAGSAMASFIYLRRGVSMMFVSSIVRSTVFSSS